MRNSKVSNKEVLSVFCRQVRARSAENGTAIYALERAGLHGVSIGLLRQELDFMTRVIYLLAIADQTRRYALIKASIEGEEWRQANGRRITDRSMVRLAQEFQGWTESVYRFGCAFIHLSRNHDYLARDPFLALSKSEQKEIVSHLRFYHGGPRASSPKFLDITPLIPSVFHKISDNLRCYVDMLEKGGSLVEERV